MLQMVAHQLMRPAMRTTTMTSTIAAAQRMLAFVAVGSILVSLPILFG
jgi:hypothetical protein